MPEEFKWNIDWKDIPEDAAPPLPPLPPQIPPQPNLVPVDPISVASPKPSVVVSTTTTPPFNPVTLPARPASPARSLVSGHRLNLVDLGCADLIFDLAVVLTKPGAHIGCLGLKENNHILKSGYFVSPKMREMPCGSCQVDPTTDGAILRLNLNHAPPELHRLRVIVFTYEQNGGSSHGAGTFEVRRGAVVTASGPIGEDDLGSGPCGLIAEIYRRDTSWRLCLLLAHQKGSIQELVTSHGATTIKSS